MTEGKCLCGNEVEVCLECGYDGNITLIDEELSEVFEDEVDRPFEVVGNWVNDDGFKNPLVKHVEMVFYLMPDERLALTTIVKEPQPGKVNNGLLMKQLAQQLRSLNPLVLTETVPRTANTAINVFSVVAV